MRRSASRNPAASLARTGPGRGRIEVHAVEDVHTHGARTLVIVLVRHPSISRTNSREGRCGTSTLALAARSREHEARCTPRSSYLARAPTRLGQGRRGRSAGAARAPPCRRRPRFPERRSAATSPRATASSPCCGRRKSAPPASQRMRERAAEVELRPRAAVLRVSKVCRGTRGCAAAHHGRQLQLPRSSPAGQAHLHTSTKPLTRPRGVSSSGGSMTRAASGTPAGTAATAEDRSRSCRRSPRRPDRPRRRSARGPGTPRARIAAAKPQGSMIQAAAEARAGAVSTDAQRAHRPLQTAPGSSPLRPRRTS